MCHGVPSPRLFKDFVSSMKEKHGSDVFDVTFREKDKGWKNQVTKVYFKNKTVWKKTSLHHYFYYYFLHNYSLRDSCYQCTEYCSHVSDLTLADDWTSNADKNENGTSLVFVNTYEGKEILKAINSQALLSQAHVPNISIYSHEGYSYERKKQWLAAYQQGFDYVSGKWYKNVSRRVRCTYYANEIKDYIKKLLRKVKKLFD